MDKFESIKAFTQVVEAGGFAAAARQMGKGFDAFEFIHIFVEREGEREGGREKGSKGGAFR
jgi:hypothetical protein